MRNITPGRGLDDIIFGLKRSEVFNIQGEPTETEHVDGDEESGAMEVWHYDELHLSLSFEEDCDWKLTSITTSNPEFLFEGIELIGLSQSEVMEQLEVFDIGEFELEDMSTEEMPEQFIGANFEFGINLFFDADILTEIQWGPYWDDEKEAPMWP